HSGFTPVAAEAAEPAPQCTATQTLGSVRAVEQWFTHQLLAGCRRYLHRQGPADKTASIILAPESDRDAKRPHLCRQWQQLSVGNSLLACASDTGKRSQPVPYRYRLFLHGLGD